RLEGDVLTDQPSEHPLDPGDDLVQVEDAGLQDLLSAEGEELPRQACGAVRGVADLLDVSSQRIVRAEGVEYELGPALNRRQQVVEVVGDPAGEPPDRL